MKNEILKCLKQTDGYVSGQELCERLGVSRTAVWKVIRQLEAEGYEIEAVRNRGYRLHDSADILNEAEIRAVLTSRWLGQNVKFFEEIDSTNNEVRRMAEQGAPEGTLVVAENQTAGKGRRGRRWDSPKGSGIWHSFLLRPEFAPEHASMLTLLAAMAVQNSVKEVTGLDGLIKWPNDIVVNGNPDGDEHGGGCHPLCGGGNRHQCQYHGFSGGNPRYGYIPGTGAGPSGLPGGCDQRCDVRF